MMTKVQAILFSEYRLIENFLEDCSADVGKTQCGRIQTEEEEEVCTLCSSVIITRLTLLCQAFWQGAQVQDRTIRSNPHNNAQFPRPRKIPHNTERFA